MANLFKRPGRVAQLGRNGFDMSQRSVFSSPCGMLLPTYTDFANPGDKYRLNSRAFVRTEALQSAAFTRFKAHLEWFFVPITQIYSLWNEFFNMTNDVMSSVFDSSISTVLPTFSLVGFKSPFRSSTGFINGSTFTYRVDEFGVPLLWNARRLCSMLYGRKFLDANTFSKFSPLSLLAYHKIFHSYYRNTYYTKNDPSSYSLDKWYNLSNSNPDALLGLFKIHYRPWRRDLFTFVQPAPVWNSSFADFLGTVGPLTDSISPSSLNPEASQNLTSLYQNSNALNGETPALASSYGVGESDYLNGVSVGDIRAAFALDKLLRITAQTGSHYDEQTLAHFGYNMPQGISNEAYRLGEQSLDININEVVATASTGVDAAGGTIGDIAGKGFGATQDAEDIEFTCPSHGYIMAVWSIEPIAEYQAVGDVTSGYSSSFDFYHPEFDGLGMQPFDRTFSSVGSDISGWQWRYMQHKTKLDSVDESIFDTSKSSWSTSRSLTPFLSDSLAARFYIYPQYTNNIFLLNFPSYTNLTGSDSGNLQFTLPSGTGFGSLGWSSVILDSENKDIIKITPDYVYSYDNFINVVDHKVFKTSVMQVYSLPRM